MGTQTPVTQHSPRSAGDIRPVRGVRTVGRLLAPEGFFQFVQSIRVAEAEIGEIPSIELGQQAPRSDPFKALAENSDQPPNMIEASRAFHRDC